MRLLSRAVSLTAVSALAAAATTVLVSPPASAAAPPTADLAGVAQVDGVAKADVRVVLYNAATDDLIGATRSDAAGEYWFDFDRTGSAGANNGSMFDRPAGAQVKLYFDYSPNNGEFPGDAFDARSEWYSDHYSFETATPITRAPAGTTLTLPPVSLTSYTGVKGTPAVAVPAGYTYVGSATFYNLDGTTNGSVGFDNDPTTPNQPTYTAKYLTPGEQYRVRFQAFATNAAGDVINYVSRFYKGGGSLFTAPTITTGAPATYLTGIESPLTDVFSPEVPPSIKGQPAPRKKVTADPGDWGFEAGNRYTYQWLLDEQPVATGPTYKLPKSAKGKKLRLVVTNENLNDGVSGTAASKAVKVGFPVALRAKATRALVNGYRVARVTGTVKVRAPKKQATRLAAGTVTVYDVVDGDLVKVGRGKVRRGVFEIVVTRLDRGKHTLEVDYSGTKKVAGDQRTVKIRL